MEALNLFHRLVPGRRQRRYRLHTVQDINRSMDSILDRLDGSKRRATYPNQSELRAVKRLKTLKMSSNGVAVAKVLEQIQLVQGMIDMNASSLNSLRTQFSTNSDLIQHEIRTLEGKLVKLFSRQLVAKQKCNEDWNHCEKLRYYPKLEQWLQVVGINEEAIKNLEEKCSTVEGLLSLSDEKVKAVLENYADGQEESRRLIAALKHLHAYTERQKQGHKDSTSDIYWDSWDTGKTREKSLSISASERSSRSSVTLDNDILLSSPSSDADTESSRLSTLSADTDGALSPKHSPQPYYFMKRSVSDDANLGNRIFINSENPNLTVGKKRGGKLEPVTPLTIQIPKSTSGDISLHSQSDSESDHNASSHTIGSPSRITHYGMGHTIKHRFSQKTFMVSLACDYCHKILLVGVKCKDCKLKFHKKCAKLAPPACGLPKGCGEFFTAQLRRAFDYRSLPMIRPHVKRTNSEPSSIALQVEKYVREQSRLNANRSHGDLNTVDHKSWSGAVRNEIPSQFRKGASGDSCSTSSSTSSPPSSPLPASTTACSVSLSAQEELDQFPESHFSFTNVSGMTSSMQSDEMIDSTSTLVRTESVKSRQSNNTTTSNDSTLSGEDVPTIDSLDTQISDVDPESKTWGRRVVGKAYMLWDLHQRGSLMSEWVIPFEELEITWSPLGTGRFGKVYRGHWHGEVAVKMIEIENPTEEQLNAFKFQVGTFRKTRHENVVLFMGACMDPPKLAIITSMCRGSSLYTHVHVRKDNLPLPKIAQICTQISQGMGYLHARGIVHTDLRSKNVFLELNNRVVITDFGLFSVAGLTTKSARPGLLMIPEGWLPYLAPEILRSLTTQQDAPDSSQFTMATDMYAFGTVWYEMCSGSWPFKKQIPEAIIWQVGKGVKQSLANVDVPREVKDTLTICWAFDADRRPSFQNLLRTLERLPKIRHTQRLHRSPSQPCTVGRGAEALI